MVVGSIWVDKVVVKYGEETITLFGILKEWGPGTQSRWWGEAVVDVGASIPDEPSCTHFPFNHHFNSAAFVTLTCFPTIISPARHYIVLIASAGTKDHHLEW